MRCINEVFELATQMFNHYILIISSLLLVFSSITYANESKSEDSLKITTHNVYFLPTALYPNWGQSQRADLISKADYIQGQDVVIFNELFDKKHPIVF